MYVEYDNVPGACGVQVVYGFEENDEGWSSDKLEEVEGGGAGWLCSGFNYNESSNEAFKYLSEKYKLVYRTPDRLNSNSGNMFFFAVFDTTQGSA
jgi:hypothetical protein